MTPTAAELLHGCVAAMSAPVAAEDLALFLKGRLSLVAILNLLVAQEAERGAAVRVAENAALREMLVGVADAYPPPAEAPADARLDFGDGDFSITALDTANATLRRRLIALHEAVEAAGDRARDRDILALYRRMAVWRDLALPPMPAAA